MRISRTRITRAAAVLGATVIIAAGCGPYMVESTWRSQPVTIDGSDMNPEWSSASYTFDTQKVTVGIMNDDQYCYLRLSTRDKSIQRRIMMGGLTVWLNGTGKKDKAMGIHFPLALQNSDVTRSKPESGQRTPPEGDPEYGGPGEDAQSRPGSDALPDMGPVALSSIELTLPETRERTSIPMAEVEAMGIMARIGFSTGRMVYELRIPMERQGDSPVFASMKRGEFIGIGLETGKVTVSQRPSGGGGGGMGGSGMMGGRGMGGGGMSGGGMGGGGGGMGEAQQQDTGESLNFWMKAHIANQS